MLAKPDIPCRSCPLYNNGQGYVPSSGTGRNGVLIVGEAAGEQEAADGTPFIGASGHTLFQQLRRIDIDREGFIIHNVLSCRPPSNKLVKQPYELEAISCCSSLLDETIYKARKVALENHKTFVIVTLGVTAFKRVLGLDHKKDHDLFKAKHYYAYPFWSDRYQAWVYNAPHPAFLVRGSTHLWPVVQFVFKRALEVAEGGLVLECSDPNGSDYLLDPDPGVFDIWIKGYLRSLEVDPNNPLSYDIETPYKKKKGTDEEELSKEDEYADHTILRISFSYWANNTAYTVSVKWSAEYLAGIEKLFSVALYVLGWNSDKYDYPRVARYVKVNGIGLDGMVAWHILNTSLPKALGFVTPYYWQTTLMWKHLSDKEPAFYNAKDAHAALINFMKIKADLIKNNLWHVYERHWIELFKALKFMTGTGVLRDNEMRSKAEVELSAILDRVEAQMEEAVPDEARDVKIYKKQPKVMEGVFTLIKDYPVDFCAACGVQNPKRWKVHTALCGGEVTQIPIPQSVWGRYLEFKVSKKRMTSYQTSLMHQAVMDRKKNTSTFNADAITVLVKKYPKDPLYPRILEHRKHTTLLSRYVGVTLPNGRLDGGMQIGPDGRIHTVYGRDASTLRFTSEDPNLQNLPRPNSADPTDLTNVIRNLVVAAPGSILYARDYSGIEAVLTGYFALDPKYIRLAKRDIHTYYTAHALYELEGGARVKACDLPDTSWPDDRLFPYLEQLKKEFKKERNSLYKHLVHAANFGQTAKGAQAKIFSETGINYPVDVVQKVMDVYYALFPSIKIWHGNVLGEAQKDGYLRNPYDYVHRFSRVYDYKREFGEWVKKPGHDANAVIAFKPQSTAVGIITEAILRLYFERFEEAGQYLRLQVHDELLLEVPRNLWEQVDLVVLEEMERPIPQMRLPASWNMGDNLVVLTEAKADFNEPSRWGSMRGL